MSNPADTQKVHVLIVDDHPMLRERLALLIRQEADMQVCGEASNIQQAMEMILAAPPDIAIVDITLKGSSGLELLKDLKARKIDLPVLVLSMHDESLYAERVLRAGARGYITKDEASEEVMAAIRCVLEGNVYLSRELTTRMLNRMSGTGTPPEASEVGRLADRELEVFRLIGEGRTTREISEQLHLGVKTVDTYRERIKQKLDLATAAELQRRAMDWVRERA
jgi:DNA-binding NarL/FixJ family response regulator